MQYRLKDDLWGSSPDWVIGRDHADYCSACKQSTNGFEQRSTATTDRRKRFGVGAVMTRDLTEQVTVDALPYCCQY